MVTVALAGKEELFEILNFYRDIGYRGGARETDTILVARIEDRVIGAVRLCTEESVIVLRGMQISREYQRQGIGTRLLNECVPFFNAGISYCLPYDHLMGFYQQIDFQPVNPAELPNFLRQRLAGYHVLDKKIIAMRRRPERCKR